MPLYRVDLQHIVLVKIKKPHSLFDWYSLVFRECL